MILRRLALVSVLCLASAATASAAACMLPKNANAMKAEVVGLVNAARAQAGLPALQSQGNVQQAAQDHACDNAATRNMSHTGSDGSSLGQRLDRAGYNWRTANENVGMGFSSPHEAVTWWMKSSGHRANILSRRTREIGVGLAVGSDRRIYWVMVSGVR